MAAGSWQLAAIERHCATTRSLGTDGCDNPPDKMRYEIYWNEAPGSFLTMDRSGPAAKNRSLARPHPALRFDCHMQQKRGRKKEKKRKKTPAESHRRMHYALALPMCTDSCHSTSHDRCCRRRSCDHNPGGISASVRDRGVAGLPSLEMRRAGCCCDDNSDMHMHAALRGRPRQPRSQVLASLPTPSAFVDLPPLPHSSASHPSTATTAAAMNPSAAPVPAPAPATTASPQLQTYINKSLRVSTSDGRYFVGDLKCTDRDRNLILAATSEYRYSPAAAAATSSSQELGARFIGLVVVPGHVIVKIELTGRAGGGLRRGAWASAGATLCEAVTASTTTSAATIV